VSRSRFTSHQEGLSLIELMIALLLGAIVVGGTLGIFHASSQTSRRTEDLARIQESARIAFELMGRSLREADGNACGVSNIGISDKISLGTCWPPSAKLDESIRGYEGGIGFPGKCEQSPNPITRVSDSDALVLVSGTQNATPVVAFDGATKKLTLQRAGDFQKDSIVFACNHDTGKGAMFKLDAAPAGSPPKIDYAEKMSAVAKVSAEGWFIAQDTDGVKALYRTDFGDTPEPIAPDIVDMQLKYRRNCNTCNDYVDASSVNDWSDVVAVHIQLTLERASASGDTIRRTISHTVNLRNRSTQ